VTRAARSTRIAVVGLAIGILFGVGAVQLATDDPPLITDRPAPTESSPETGFARDMAVHHAQAVEMADIVRTRTQDPELVTLATDIVLTQQNQIGRFYGWLDQWALPATHATPMDWMGGHHAMSATMPGVAIRAEVRDLAELPQDSAEIQFLRLMIRHHRGGVEMANHIVELSERPEVVAVASAVVTSQQSEIDVMNAMLDTRGAPAE
jgi:uncharacterized protein (DUF305 family)